MSQKKPSSFKFSLKLGPTEENSGPAKLKIKTKTKTKTKEHKLKQTRRSTTPNLAKRNPIPIALATLKPNKAIKTSTGHEHKPKKAKTSKNWYLMWTKIDNPNSAPIYIKRWVRLEESETPNPIPIEKTMKTESKLFACKLDDCDKVFMDSGNLKKHLASHGEKLFDCPFETCGKKFVDKSKLKRHQLVHTGERPYGCEICGKKFSLDFNLRTHIRTHTGLKPYGCKFNGCQKRFTQSSNLVAHEKTHIKGDDKVEKVDKGDRTEAKPESKKTKYFEIGNESSNCRDGTREHALSNIEQDMMNQLESKDIKEFLKGEFENLRRDVDHNGLGKVLLTNN